MQLVARTAPIVLVKVWDVVHQFVPVREQLPGQLLFVQQSVLVPFQPGHPSHERKSAPLGYWYQLNPSDYES